MTLSPEQRSWAALVSRTSGFTAIGVGGLVLIGWFWRADLFVSIRPELSSMKPNTAVAFIASGTALLLALLLDPDRTSRLRRRLAMTVPVAPLLIGLLTLTEYALHRDLGVDQILFRDVVARNPGSLPGQMAPSTACAFVALGLALLLLHVKGNRGWLAAQWFAVLPVLIAGTALLGYLYRITALYQFHSFTGVALHTAATLMLLSVGILCARPESGLLQALLRQSPGAQLFRQSVPYAVLALIFLGWLWLEGRKHEYFSTEAGVGALVVIRCLVFAILVFHAGRLIDRRVEQLALHEERTRLIVDSLKDHAIVFLDAQRCIRSWSVGAEQIMQYRAEEIVGKDFSLIYPPQDVVKEKPVRDIERASALGRSEDEGWRVRRDGKQFWAHTILAPVVDKVGVLLGFSMITQDLTARMRMESRLRAVVEAAPLGMVMIDSTGAIILVNRETERLFGYLPLELIGVSMEVLMPERFRTGHRGMRREFFACPEARRMGVGRELFGLRKDGSEFPVEIGLSPIELEEGTFVLSAVTDITERSRSEAERQSILVKLQAFTAELEERIRQHAVGE